MTDIDAQQVRALSEMVSDLREQLSRKELERWNWEQSSKHRARELADLQKRSEDAITEMLAGAQSAEQRIFAANVAEYRRVAQQRDDAQAEVARLQRCLSAVVECGVYCADCGSYCTARDEASFTGDAEHAEWTCSECLRDQETAS